MDKLAAIAESIQSLHSFLGEGSVFLDEIQQEFRPDLQHYIAGATLSMQQGRIVIGKKLYKEWLEKIKAKGFDYEIDFK